MDFSEAEPGFKPVSRSSVPLHSVAPLQPFAAFTSCILSFKQGRTINIILTMVPLGISELFLALEAERQRNIELPLPFFVCL